MSFNAFELDLRSQYVSNLLPPLDPNIASLFCDPPESLQLEVPFFLQEKEYYSAAACVQMTQEYLGMAVDTQTFIAQQTGWDNWSTLTHASYKEDYAHYLISLGMLTYHYYPQSFVATKLQDGLAATELIRRNATTISQYDFKAFKALLAHTQAPLKARVHFDGTQYPMPPGMAEKIDMSGHCIMIVGYNSEGFIVHDPWDQGQWGGSRGGAYQVLPYKELINTTKLVNYSLEEVEPTKPVKAYVDSPREAVLTNGQFEIEAYFEWPGIRGLSMQGCQIEQLQATITVGPGLTVVGSNVFTFPPGYTVTPGEMAQAKWTIQAGSTSESIGVSVLFEGTQVYPAIPWEGLSPVSNQQAVQAEGRVCLFDPSYLSTAGIL